MRVPRADGGCARRTRRRARAPTHAPDSFRKVAARVGAGHEVRRARAPRMRARAPRAGARPRRPGLSRRGGAGPEGREPRGARIGF